MSESPQSPMHLMVDQFLSTQSLPLSEDRPCPYLSDRRARNEGFAVEHLPPDMYRALMDRGFRRSGEILYRPRCEDCRECRQLRIIADDFIPSRSQRRVRRINGDVAVAVNLEPTPTDDKWRLFKRYIDHQHDDSMGSERENFDRFLYDSPTESREITYTVGDRLIGVSLADRCPDVLSSVYMYFDPAHAHRSLGTFSILWEIDYCRRGRIPYYYLGYYVAGSHNMDYKARFKPHELLDDANVWYRVHP